MLTPHHLSELRFNFMPIHRSLRTPAKPFFFIGAAATATTILIGMISPAICVVIDAASRAQDQNGRAGFSVADLLEHL